MKTGLLGKLLLAGIAAAAMIQPAHAISVSVVGTPANVVAGDSFVVDIVVTGIVDEIISAWDIDVAFDPALVDNGAVTWFNADWDLSKAIFDADFQNGLTDVWLVSLLSDADLFAAQCPGGVCGPTWRLARLSFIALAAGSPVISLVNWGPDNDIKCEKNRQCYPEKVPEPGTLILLGLGLTGLALGRRRRS